MVAGGGLGRKIVGFDFAHGSTPFVCQNPLMGELKFEKPLKTLLPLSCRCVSLYTIGPSKISNLSCPSSSPLVTSAEQMAKMTH